MTQLVSVSDYERRASEVLPRSPWQYYQSGAEKEHTLQLNKSAYDRLRIRPRVLIDVSKRCSKTNILGIDVDMPIAIAATAMQRMAHPEGELATVRAAGNLNTIYTLSTLSTTSIEDVATAGPNTVKWFQLYIYKDRVITERLVRRAEAAGFKALVLTVDAPVFGIRRSDIKNQFKLPNHLELANFTGELGVLGGCDGSALNAYVTNQFDASLNWSDVQWLVNFTKLPVILKGIVTKEDALLAAKSGCKGIIVSNHGARQLDSAPATIEALPEVAKAVGSQMVVMLDGGIRTGTDVFKAIALGAQLVLVGRPVLYGLAVNGQQGIEDVIGILQQEFDIAMALAGVSRVKEINENFVVHESQYAKCKL